jgi:hypothetical protein
LSVVQNKAKRSQFGLALTRVLWVGMVAALMATAEPARAVQIDKTEIDLVVDPNAESMTAQVRLTVSENVENQQLVCTFLKPTRMDYCRDATSKRNLSYKFELTGSLQNGLYQFTVNLGRLGRECTIELGYTYTGKDFYGSALNPTTLDNFSLGQITSQSVHLQSLVLLSIHRRLDRASPHCHHCPAGMDGGQCGRSPDAGVTRQPDAVRL